MIARHESTSGKEDLWAQISAPLPKETISWRQDGRPTQRDGKFFARFVCYIEANTVRERLDAVVAGEWDLTLELLPPLAQDEPDSETACAFKARLQILGVIREDVGHGRDYKQAATDAFKRAAVRFGIAHELYAYGQNWVQVDGDGKYAKPIEDPNVAYERRLARTARPQTTASTSSGSSAPSKSSTSTQPKPAPSSAEADSIDERAPLDETPATGPLASDEVMCPKCGGRTWDNRLSKRNPKAPDFKCRSRSCDGVIWPPRAGEKRNTAPAQASEPDNEGEYPRALLDEPDELPF